VTIAIKAGVDDLPPSRTRRSGQQGDDDPVRPVGRSLAQHRQGIELPRANLDCDTLRGS